MRSPFKFLDSNEKVAGYWFDLGIFLTSNKEPGTSNIKIVKIV